MPAPPRAVLIVVDMQAYFASMTTQALPKITRLVRHFRSRALPVLFTQHGHDAADLSGPPYSNQLVRKWGVDGSIHRGSGDWEFQPEIEKLIRKGDDYDDDYDNKDGEVVHKNTYDAFINTDLEARLRRVDVGRVVVCGVMTDCCCDTTARSAFNRGWETWLVRDACGSANKAQHEAGLRGFGFAFGDVLTAEEVISLV
ncbi:Isochorismatase hydrolase [Xylariomycetidae sp. FL2044]|nr:Isochorismatase hydrolase [Xylariomycetidae sp. FL2044]KAH9885743.1 Isochorismatase hydrolase [Xylariomycetidae sp. FL2044]